MPADFDPEPILSVLVDHGVEFVLIGGLAALAQGSPFPTEDADITPDRSPDNLTRLSAALAEVDARVRADGDDDGPPFAHDATSLAASDVWNLTTPYGDLDVSMVPTGTDGYADLVRGSREIEAFSVRVRVASLEDVVRSKQAANRPKDQRVLPVLRELLATRRDRGER